jgi:Cyclic nucleotide-binding domain
MSYQNLRESGFLLLGEVHGVRENPLLIRHAIRLCVLNPTSSEADIRRVIEHFASAPAAPAARPVPGGGDAPADARTGVVAGLDRDELRSVPLLARVPASTLEAVRARADRLDTAPGEEIIRRWDADRSFYIVLAGRFDVFIDGRRIRTVGPGDHVGELAARDWGGGYGYTRLATVVCAEPGRLLRLSSEDFQWLIDTDRRSTPSWPGSSPNGCRSDAAVSPGPCPGNRGRWRSGRRRR